MGEKIKECVSVNLLFNHKKRKTSISKIIWKNKVYNMATEGLHYTFKKGDTLVHVFSVASKDTTFKLILDTKSLVWSLDEVYDSSFK